MHPAASQQAVVEAALLMLERMGLSPADLAAAPQDRPPVPTFAEYVPVVSAAVSAGTRRAYGSYWNRVIEHWGEPAPGRAHPVGDPAADVLRQDPRRGPPQRPRRAQRRRAPGRRAALPVQARRGRRADHRGGQPGPEGGQAAPPAVHPPGRHRTTRLAEINQVAATTGDDPELDTLLLRLHTETACRRGGALALRPQDLDPDQCLILLREKGETVRWQPVSPTLMARLVEHGQERHAPPDGQLLRYADGRPITSRRYDHLWARIGRHLPWVRTQQISMHWIRHILRA